MPRTGSGGPGTRRMHPLEAALPRPPERAAHGVRHRVAVEAAPQSLDDGVATSATTTGAPVPTRQAEPLVGQAAPAFAVFDEPRGGATPEAVPRTRRVLVLRGDGKGVPLRKTALREGPRRAAEAPPPPRCPRRKTGARAHPKRMAPGAAVSPIAPWVRPPDAIGPEWPPAQAVSPARPRPDAQRVGAARAPPPVEVRGQAASAPVGGSLRGYRCAPAASVARSAAPGHHARLAGGLAQ